MLKYITATTHASWRSKMDEFLMHMIEHFVNITDNLQIDVLWCECLGDNWRCFDFPQFWVILPQWTPYHPDLSEHSDFTQNFTQISLLNHPDLTPSPIFEGGHLPVNSLNPNDAICCHGPWSVLVQVTYGWSLFRLVTYLVTTHSFTKPMLNYCQLEPEEWTSMKLKKKKKMSLKLGYSRCPKVNQTKGPVTLPKIRVNAWITHKFRVLRDTSAICAFHQFFWRGTSAVVRRCSPYRCFTRFQVLSSSKLGFA